MIMKERRASIQTIKSNLKLSILNENDIRSIDHIALTLLEETGVRIKIDKALRIYADHGASVDFKKQIVKIPSTLVKKSMEKAPRFFTMSGRSRTELDLKIDGSSGTYFNTSGCAAKAVDIITRKERKS